jgi:hypothetical protein
MKIFIENRSWIYSYRRNEWKFEASGIGYKADLGITLENITQDKYKIKNGNKSSKKGQTIDFKDKGENFDLSTVTIGLDGMLNKGQRFW